MLMPDAATADRPLEARVAVRVAEGSGRPVERVVTQALAPAAAMIGVKPLFDGVVAENAEARFTVAAVGPDGKATAMAAAGVQSITDLSIR